MPKICLSAEELTTAFPASLRHDALTAVSTFPAVRELGGKFVAFVGAERVAIPRRVHFDASLAHLDELTPLQRELVDCLLTRHTNGYLRQQHLARIVGLNHAWIPPFVVQLAGEYVVEILDVIHKNLSMLGKAVYAEFLHNNPTFLDVTSQRVASYWDCYYRSQRQDEYVGFKLVEFFRSLQYTA